MELVSKVQKMFQIQVASIEDRVGTPPRFSEANEWRQMDALLMTANVKVVEDLQEPPHYIVGQYYKEEANVVHIWQSYPSNKW